MASTSAGKLVFDPETIVSINGFQAPPVAPRRPVHAVKAVAKLILNKDDTRQVFEIASALAGDAGHRLFKRFTSTTYGRRVVETPVKLEDVLSRFEDLRRLPAGSLGRAYLDFMEEAGFTPQGLIAASEEAGFEAESDPPLTEYRRMFRHAEMSHDLWHVLTGYGRDPLGEALNLIFSRQQTYNPGLKLIYSVALVAMKAERPALPIFEAARQAHAMGRGVDFLLQHDVEALLPRPLADVRRDLGFIEPTIYASIPLDVRHALLRPKLKSTQTEREQNGAAAAAA
jgi:ubiquinone biosynthesis protein COQ4